MPDTAPNTELLRSLGRLVRGLTALFWGLPIALIVCVQTAKADWLKSFGIVPPLLVTGWLLYGLWQLEHFQKQERIWMELAAKEIQELLPLLDKPDPDQQPTMTLNQFLESCRIAYQANAKKLSGFRSGLSGREYYQRYAMAETAGS